MRGGDLGDDDRVKMLSLGDLEGGRGNEEYLFRLVNNPPFRLVSEELSSRPDSFLRGYGPFSSWGVPDLTSSKARRPLSDDACPDSLELLTQLLSRRSSGQRAVFGLSSSLTGSAEIAEAESRMSVGRLGNWSLDGGSGTISIAFSGREWFLSAGVTRIVDGGNAPSLVCLTVWSGLDGSVSDL